MSAADDLALFAAEEFDDWRQWWTEMPAFSQRDEMPFDTLKVHFSNSADRRWFLSLVGEDPARRSSIWFPSVQRERYEQPGGVVVPPNLYPVYVISKGRSDSRLTIKALDLLGIHHRVVIEPQEFNAYNEHINAERLLVLPFSNLGQGSIPARNFVWDHSTQEGHQRHWILDDNIDGFSRLLNNKKFPVVDENPFASVENFCDRFANLPMAGLNYRFLAKSRQRIPGVYFNTRVYSCILLTNATNERWRGRYNEDTDLSLRFLKSGQVTALFNHFLCNKQATMTSAGGNTDELYAQTEEFDGRRAMAESLAEQHPDVATVSWKWGRVQHHVNYAPFKRNKLIPLQERQSAT